MNYYCLTLFPEMIESTFNTSITGRAAEAGLLSLKTTDIRDFSKDKHMKVDDYPYGGGAGLVMKADCVYYAYAHIKREIDKKRSASDKLDVTKRTRVCFMTPKGRTLNQDMAKELAEEEDLIILCGHYEGIDERVLEEIVTDNISIGDYVLTGGELAALVLMDAVSRFVPGVLGNNESAHTDSFGNGLLEHPQYTRPESFHGKRVPAVLLSGNHARIDEWRMEKSLEITKKMRPDLYDDYVKNNPPEPKKRPRR
ncbi:MAG: tRNA (guanosine(37)-N1)-methyltransferase TrmD [Clostridiales bacterium]|nr:tRNA (guanosine(37)-N1)-methyltransferase TrmD [Clostridiales bacterium]MBS5878176.1 tRNA (guanosine(37)-N1)-methyltransferase TrmD [Clostridiales bacterium]MDU0939354.1 tRNA (guanosine(37)-N1)-methyltransferase TrmD [Clostridiales bacterium]MDU1042338.1 tRNA (guanosine(37)-N1)-methyltransferase TrmD [Clostridiales bacterium]MDU3490082.1 tRNA (guanosine(37)-N1)-methyltransferase TrmD [Clostridiales bacterium]